MGIAEKKQELLREVMENGIESSPRGQNIRELICKQINVDTFETIASYPSKPYSFKYLSAEIIRYIFGNYKVGFIGKNASLREKIADSNGNVNSNYGKMTMDGQRIAIEKLRQDKDSRQAIVHYNQKTHINQKTKDFPCTMFQQYLIRDNKLYGISNMRSNDLFFGFDYDIVWFSMATQNVLLELKKDYPNLVHGGLIHSASSLHIYENMFKKASKIINEEGESRTLRMDYTFDEMREMFNKDILEHIHSNCESSSQYIYLLKGIGIHVERTDEA